jgi:hypothetical protein
MFRKLLRNRKGVTAMVLLLVVTLVSIALIIPIGLMVTTELGDAIGLIEAKGSGTTKAENITYDVFDSLWTSWSLSSLIPIIAVAAALIAIIVGAFTFQRARG